MTQQKPLNGSECFCAFFSLLINKNLDKCQANIHKWWQNKINKKKKLKYTQRKKIMKIILRTFSIFGESFLVKQNYMLMFGDLSNKNEEEIYLNEGFRMIELSEL